MRRTLHLMGRLYPATYAIVLLSPILSTPAEAHNGAVAIAMPVEGIKLDGDFSDWPADLRRYPIAHKSGDAPLSAEDIQGFFHIGYQTEGNVLYVAVEVQDDSIVEIPVDEKAWHTQDGCWVFLEIAHKTEDTNPALYALEGNQILVRGTAVREAVEVATRRSEKEHRYEWKIAVGAMGSGEMRLQADRVLGFDIVLIDRDGDQSTSSVVWGSRGIPAVWDNNGFRSSLTLDSGRMGDLVLGRPAAALGRVQGYMRWRDSGEGIGRSRVRLQALASEHLQVVAGTDRQGYYTVHVPAGRYAVETGFGRQEKESVSVEVEAGRETKVDLTLPPPSGLEIEAGPGKETKAGRGLQQGFWLTFDTADGLLSSTILSIFQDRRGDMWFGTHFGGGGLSRYDGVHFQNFTPEDGLLDPTVTDILEDRAGYLWFGTGIGYLLRGELSGLSRYDGHHFLHFTPADGLVHYTVNTLFEDRVGHLWIGTQNGLSRWDGVRFENFTMEDGLANNDIRDICQDRAGFIWFATWGGGVSRWDGKRFENFTPSEGLAGWFVRTVLEDRTGGLWFGTSTGLSRYDGRDFTTFTTVDGLADDHVRALLEDRVGHLWIGTQNGLSRYDGTRFEIFTAQDGLADNQVSAIWEDHEGNLWFGTGTMNSSGGGVSRYAGGHFTRFTPADGLMSKGVMSLYEDRAGAMWFGTWGGVNKYDGERLTTLEGLRGFNVWDMVEDGTGAMWFTSFDGLLRYDGTQVDTFRISDGLPTNLVTSVEADSEGYLWASAAGGVVRYNGRGAAGRESDRDSASFAQYFTAGYDLEGIIPIAKDQAGRLWFSDGGKFRIYDGGKGRSDPEHPTDLQFASFSAADSSIGTFLYEDRAGHLWFKSKGGMSRYDGENFAHFTMEDGLALDYVTDIMEDREGQLWISTYGGGVSCYDGLVFQNLDRRSGLSHNGVHQTWQDRNGDVWIAAEMGVTRYRPGRTPPPVQLTDVVADRRYGLVDQLRLPSTQTFVAFEFQGRSYKTLRDQMAYVYRLVGYDDEWRSTRQTSVEYADLPMGDYVFEVKAVDRDLTYSEEPATMRLAMHPPYGQIALAAGLLLAVLGMAIAARSAVRRRGERDQARRDLAQERRQRVEVQPHDIEAWTLEDFVEQSPAMQLLFDQIRRLQEEADNRALITGEAGTGKELIARALHAGSARGSAVFAAVRCAALPTDVAQSLAQRTQALSQLFGHVPGAFAGADSERDGYLQQATGGSLFLDEIGLLPLPLQSHLLRVLTEREVRRVGAQEAESIDVRVLAATSMDLSGQVQSGDFHAELYEYLAPHTVAVSPLRERVEDIEPLAQHFARELMRKMGQAEEPLGVEVMAQLQGYAFPGNVRELKNIIERALIESGGRPLEIEHLGRAR